MTLYTLIILPNETSTYHLDFRFYVMHLHLKEGLWFWIFICDNEIYWKFKQ